MVQRVSHLAELGQEVTLLEHDQRTFLEKQQKAPVMPVAEATELDEPDEQEVAIGKGGSKEMGPAEMLKQLVSACPPTWERMPPREGREWHTTRIAGTLPSD